MSKPATTSKFSNLSMKSSLIGLVLISLIVITAIALAMPDYYRYHIKLKLRTALMDDRKYAFIEPQDARFDMKSLLQEEDMVKKKNEELQQQKIQDQLKLFQQFQQFQAQANSGNFIQMQQQVAPVAGQPAQAVGILPPVAPGAVGGVPAAQAAVVPVAGGVAPAEGAAAPVPGAAAPVPGAAAPVAIAPAEQAVLAAEAADPHMTAKDELEVNELSALVNDATTDGDAEETADVEEEEDDKQSQKEYHTLLRKMIDTAVKDTIPLPDAEIDDMAKQISKEVPFVLNVAPHKAWQTPCWMNKKKLMCLPSVYVLGFKRCAYKDLYYRITAHNQLIFSWRAESQFWSRDDAMGLKETMLNYGANVYLKGMFDKSQVLIEGMADPLWNQLYTNETSRPVPRSLLNAQLAKKFTPKAKFIAILRSPTDSAASFYVYLRRPDISTQDDFHKNIGEIVKQYKTCVKENGYDPCFGNGFLHENLLYWTYIMYLKDWMAVFPKEQFFFIKMEEWADPRKRMFVLRDLFKFLEVKKTPPKTLQLLAAMHRVNDESRRWYNPNLMSMLPSSKKMLDDFYAPFNEALADFIGNEKFKWDEEHEDEKEED